MRIATHFESQKAASKLPFLWPILAIFVMLFATGCSDGEPVHKSNYENIPIDRLFQQYCYRCHVSGRMGAPLQGDTAEWQRREQDRAVILRTAIAGKGGMPPRGGCGNCSDERLAELVDYLIDGEKAVLK